MARLLQIDLSNTSYFYREIPIEWIENYIGGRGLAARFLYESIEPGIDPLGPNNYLVFSIGPFTGSNWPASTQYHVSAKSPLTNGYGCGLSWGTFGRRMRELNIDLLVFTGKSNLPVFAVISENSVEFTYIADLWGSTISQTESKLKEQYEDSVIAAIGPAGENLVGLSTIVSEGHRAVLRSGMGAVMGSKMLKAVILKAPSKPTVFSPEFNKISAEKFFQVASHPASKRLKEYGKAFLINSKNVVGDLPTKNHQYCRTEGVEKINAEALKAYLKGTKTCPSCPISCIRITEVKSGRFKCCTEGPCLEDLAALGPRLGCVDLEAIIFELNLCIELGLDPVGVGGTIAFAMECYQRGLIDDYNVHIQWGDTEAIIKLIKEIAYKKSFGEILADGSFKAAKQIGRGSEEYAMQVKGIEISGQEPRLNKSFGLALATSNWGGDWSYGLPTIDCAGNVEAAKKLLNDYLPEIMDVTNPKYKPELVYFCENYNAISDSVGICKFSAPETYAIYPSDIAEGLSILRKRSYSSEELMQIAKRIIDIERKFNFREGFSYKDDLLPLRFIKEPMFSEIFQGDRIKGLKKTGKVINSVIELEEMLKKYYQLRGWNEKGEPIQ